MDKQMYCGECGHFETDELFNDTETCSQCGGLTEAPDESDCDWCEDLELEILSSLFCEHCADDLGA